MSDKDKDSENRASKGPTEFEFSRYETHSLRVVKLKRPLPANLAGTHYALVETAARLIGFVRTNKDDFKTPFLIWNDTFISMERLTQLKPFQRVNHFPGMAEICRKDLLAKNMGKLNQRYPSEYKFAPRTWCLPDQLANFRQHTQEQKSEVKPSYICKPVDGTSGRGIKIYRTAEEVPQTVESQCVLQEYVSNPFLIENVKFDLRLYVLVSSCDPLRIYLFNDGFIRMSSEPYVDPQKCKADEDLNFIHLTNCSVNKQNRPTDTYGAASRRRGAKVSGMKRPLMFLNSYLQQNKYDVALVWRRIVDLIIKTVFAAYPHVVRSYRQCRPTETRLKRQDRMKDVDTRICQRFRCIFPVDDATKQEKLVSVMLDAISALLEGSQMEALHREVKTFNASKTDEVAKKLAQLGSKTVQQLMDDGQAGSSGSDSEIDDQAAGGRRKPAAGRLPLKDGQKKSLRKSQEKQKDPAQKQPHPSESMMANEREQLAQRTLKFLNELSIRFPGKSNRAAEQMLRQLQDNWLARKADVSSYWRLSLDADKRRKVIDIARQNVRIALDKALRMTASDVAAAADNLASLFEKLYNRLLWCHGQGLWETFAGNTGWELILR
uniref:Tubulin--tyrosine ligase-like protein 9 n=1 Tax=Macrostomum lignano TaxID=282301 RepID=A0A1I8GM16_9PLAT